MSQLRWIARFYIASVLVAAALVFGLRAGHIHVAQPLVFALLVGAALLATALNVRLPLPGGGSTMSLSHAVEFASLVILGADFTMALVAVTTVVHAQLNPSERRPIYRTMFGVATAVLSVQAAGFVLWRMSGLLPLGSEPVGFPVRLVAAATLNFMLNTMLGAAELALSSGTSAWTTWETQFLWSAPKFFVSALVGGTAAQYSGRAGLWLVPVAFVPVYLTYRAYQMYIARLEAGQCRARDLADLHLATVEALARAIDARDQPSSAHLQRVQLYATHLARRVGLSEAEVEAIKTASLLHDIGKLAVPEHILSKPGRLTEEEFQRVRIHPAVGAEIVADVPFPSPVAPAILGHHERWDGKGYPHGLRGEDIPLGARILSLVDYFEAVTAHRPYHPPMRLDLALEVIKNEAGHALDPRLVQEFVALVPSLAAQDAALRESPAKGLRALAGPYATPAAVSPVTHNVYEHIAVAHREINALYEISQAMSAGLGVTDTMEIISSKLMKIVPWTGCALFLLDAEGQRLRCGYATGPDAVRLFQHTMPIEGSLCGWVVRNRRTLLNANPAITFLAAGLEGTTLKSAIVCPLVSNDALIGVLSLFHVDEDRYTEEHRRLLERVADQAGTALYNSVIFDRTQEDALTDALTLLPNRRSMSAHFARELARAERATTEFAVVVIDIDGFKAINDTYGHTVGDWALREVATTLSAQLRPYDLCGRYAGDEFVVILADCSRDGAEARRRELQQRIQAIALQVGSETLKLGASAGVAVYPHDGVTYESLISAADRRMYSNKTSRASAAVRVPLVNPPSLAVN